MIHPAQALARVMMRRTEEARGSPCSQGDLQQRIPARHRPRKIRRVVHDALASPDGEFAALHTDLGRCP